MKPLIFINLTILFMSIVNKYHPNCNHSSHKDIITAKKCRKQTKKACQNLGYITKILESKSVNKFGYKKTTFSIENRETIVGDFNNYHQSRSLRSHVRYTYDENTMNWICMLPELPRKLVNILVDAGIVKYSNGNGDIINYSFALCNCIHHTTKDDDIHLLVSLGFKLANHSYRDYGCRKDRTFAEKKEMFKRFHEYGLLPNYEIRNNCLFFSNQIDEVVYFINFIDEMSGQKEKGNMIYSFATFGTSMFEILYKMGFAVGIPPGDQYFFGIDRPIEEKMEAISLIKTKYCPSINLDAILTSSLKLHNISLIKFLLNLGAKPDRLFFLDTLLIRSYGDNDDFDFYSECADYILSNTDLIIPCNKNCCKYHDRDSYKCNGRLFDFLIANNPKMQESFSERTCFEIPEKQAGSENCDNNIVDYTSSDDDFPDFYQVMSDHEYYMDSDDEY